MPTTTSGHVSADESRMLITSLQRLGWPLKWIEKECGLPAGCLRRAMVQQRVTRERRAEIRVAFLALRSRRPRGKSLGERNAISKALAEGRRYGGVAPWTLPDRPWRES